MTRLLCFALLVAACDSSPPQDGPDGGVVDPDGGPGTDAEVPLCQPACEDETNAEVTCSVFGSCESTCSSGFARCGDSCVTESVQQCGPGCATCRTPENGAAVCRDGVCGVTCEPGYVECSEYGGPSCCAFASEVVAPVDMGGYMPSIAIDDDGALHVAYYRSAEHELVYTKETANGLVREVARWYWSSGGGARFALALAGSGPVIAYTYPNSASGLFLAERRSRGWAQSTLFATGTPTGFAIAADRGGRLHACFTYNGAISYAQRAGDRWTIMPVGSETEARGACAIAADADGVAHIAWHRVTSGDVAYARGDTLTAKVVDSAGSVGSQLAIAVGVDGAPAIAAYRSDTEVVRYATLSGTTWSATDVGGAEVGSAMHLAIGTAGPVITWFDYFAYRVVIAMRTNGQWSGGSLEDATGGAAPTAVAPDGRVWLTTGDGTVLAHELVGAGVASYIIDTADQTGDDVQLVHRNGQPTLVYDVEHENTRNVEVATRTSSGWRRSKLATAGTAPSAAVDGLGKIHVAYQTGTTVSYAVESGTSFAIEPVATNASQAYITIDGVSAPLIAYVTGTSGSYSLMLATKKGSTWTTETVGGPAPYGTYTNPVVKVGGGFVHVMWGDSIAKVVAYASSADDYTRVVVESNAEGTGDLYIAPGGALHACLYRRGTSWPSLRYATRSGTTWSSVAVSKPGTSSEDDGVCAIRGNGNGDIAIARGIRYGVGLGAVILSRLGTTVTHTTLQDDFYGRALSLSVGATDFEVATTGQPYNGSGYDQHRVRWMHR